MAKKQVRAASGSARNLETQAAILSAAAAVLQEHGYGGFSIDAVARRCGAGRPTIYRWWPNKAALLVEVYIGQSISITRPAPNTGSVRGDLIQHIRRLWRFWIETPSGRAFRALVAESQADPLALVQLRDQALPQARFLVATVLRRGIERGEIAVDVDLELVIDLIWGFNWYRLLTDRLDPKNIEPTIDLLLSGVRAKPSVSNSKAARAKSAKK
jgi:AcrR family transcriptional regulator